MIAHHVELREDEARFDWIGLDWIGWNPSRSFDHIKPSRQHLSLYFIVVYLSPIAIIVHHRISKMSTSGQPRQTERQSFIESLLSILSILISAHLSFLILLLLLSSACSHLSSVRQPSSSQQVYREECTQCFQDDASPDGINVCLNCFNGGCTGEESMQHSQHHVSLCHPVVLNIKKKPIMKEEVEDVEMSSTATATSSAEQLKQLQQRLESESSQPQYFYESQVRCLACNVDIPSDATPQLASCVEAVLASKSMAESAGVAMVQEDIKQDCPHMAHLEQVSSPPQLGDRSLTTCSSCDVRDKMWLCLTCGALGCSRRQMQFDGSFSVGNGHAVAHADATGHPVVVKIGTITAEGRGDCYCYKCDSSIENPNLGKQLETFGIPIASQTATEQTTADLNLELNLKMNWNSVFESDGREAELAFGPGKTGLANLGNSCYLASVVQVLFTVPHFVEKYYSQALQHLSRCTSSRPADCFTCQMSKLAIGLLSGRYDRTPSAEILAEIAQQRAERESRQAEGMKEETESAVGLTDDKKKKKSRAPLQSGIPPRMFKRLTAGKHYEFSSGRQQDAYEYVHYLLDFIKQKEHSSSPPFDPYQPFQFYQEERLECLQCHQVKYSQVKATELGLNIPLPEPLPPKEDEKMVDDSKQSSSSDSSKSKPKKPTKSYPPVSFDSCLSAWSQSRTTEGWMCPTCNVKTSNQQSSRMTTFPSILMVHMRRFVLDGWVPEKLDIDVELPKNDDGSFGAMTLDGLRAKGLQAGEVELPKDSSSSSSSAIASEEKRPDPAIVAQLEQMGFTTNACQRAALAVENASAEAATNWLFAHMEDANINDPLPASAPAPSSSSSSTDPSPDDIANLASMGFDPTRCKHALKQCGNNAERAVEWLFSHMDEDIQMEEAPANEQTPHKKEEGHSHENEREMRSSIGMGSTVHGWNKQTEANTCV